MGYAVPNQEGRGIHMRLHARAFAIGSDEPADPSIMFVSIDGGMGSDLLTSKVLSAVAAELEDDSIYTFENFAISGTHTHSGPAGFLQYILYQFTSFGYVEETMDAFVTGITEAVVEAHRSMVPSASITYADPDNTLLDSNINRSPTSYAPPCNPPPPPPPPLTLPPPPGTC
jgi:neutral ceramidase